MAKDLTAALHALTVAASGKTSRVDQTLPAARATTDIPSRTGVSSNKTASASGIASPLVEIDYAAREFHANHTILSSDGVFAMVVKPVKKITFLDALGNTVVMEYKAPV